MFWKKKPSEEDIQEKYMEYEMADKAFQVDASLEQMRREFGPETYIVKDDLLQNILFNLAFNIKKDGDGKPVRDEYGSIVLDGVASERYLGLLEFLNSLNATSWIDRPWAEYLVSTVHKIQYKTKLRLKLKECMDEMDYKKSEILDRLEYEKILQTLFLGSLIDGRRVQALKTQPHLFRAEFRRSKKEKEKKGGGWW